MSAPRIELPDGVLAVRRGPGANCSSIGSVVDLLFATVVTAGVVYAFVATALPERAEEPLEESPPPEDEP
ncbi:MAG: hypothetical protein JNL79_10315 [Myxococcales bacterium]|nr:hypothetical protein [Myxococcales bacterium]